MFLKKEIRVNEKVFKVIINSNNEIQTFSLLEMILSKGGKSLTEETIIPFMNKKDFSEKLLDVIV